MARSLAERYADAAEQLESPVDGDSDTASYNKRVLKARRRILGIQGPAAAMDDLLRRAAGSRSEYQALRRDRLDQAMEWAVAELMPRLQIR